jgi:type IV pilus assembly protein PilE
MRDEPAMSTSRIQGFTLIELMVTVAVVSILTTVAVASYRYEVLKSYRTDARTALLDMAGREERYYSLNNTYTSTPGDLGYAGLGAGTSVGSNSEYQLDTPNWMAATATMPATFTLEADAIGTQVNDTSCEKFFVTSGGQQYSQDGNGNDTTSTCWQ